MALLPLLYFPDPKLKLVAEPVEAIDAQIQQTVEDMFETMYEAQGVGLAAIQVNVQKRIIVIDISQDSSEPMCLINPEIIEAKGELFWQEGCLSFPNVFARVKRYHDITVKFLDKEGKEQTISAEGGLLSACIQHEIDHLDGITFYDHLSHVKQKMLRDKIRKMKQKRL